MKKISRLCLMYWVPQVMKATSHICPKEAEKLSVF
jgi:hypothetical protein